MIEEEVPALEVDTAQGSRHRLRPRDANRRVHSPYTHLVEAKHDCEVRWYLPAPGLK